MSLDAAIALYREQGWARLGPVADAATVAALAARSEQIMREGDPKFFFQRDAPTGRYDDVPRGSGWTGPGLDYRKVEKLEKDPLFARYIENDLFRRIAQEVIGGEIVLCRAVLFTKSAAGGTQLPWHQDGGSFWGLDQDPVLQLWTALDDVPLASGCVEVVSKSHLAGLATPLGGVIPDEVSKGIRGTLVPAAAGEGLILHNYAWHRSGTNATGKPRRALTVCFMSASNRCTRRKRAPRVFQPVFRSGEPTPT